MRHTRQLHSRAPRFKRGSCGSAARRVARSRAINDHLNGYTGCIVYTVAEAKNKLPKLIRQAEAGVRVTITKRGVPVVEIVRKLDDAPRKRVFGVLGKKKIVIDPDWARPQEDMDAWLAGDV